MARHKGGKIIRLALRGGNAAEVLRNDYIQGTQQGANIFVSNFMKYLQNYVPEIKQRYLRILMEVTGKTTPAEALKEYYAHKSLYNERVWKRVIEETSKIAADYKAREIQNMVAELRSKLQSAASSVAASEIENLAL